MPPGELRRDDLAALRAYCGGGSVSVTFSGVATVPASLEQALGLLDVVRARGGEVDVASVAGRALMGAP